MIVAGAIMAQLLLYWYEYEGKEYFLRGKHDAKCSILPPNGLIHLKLLIREAFNTTVSTNESPGPGDSVRCFSRHRVRGATEIKSKSGLRIKFFRVPR
jgi:hypothetical protein